MRSPAPIYVVVVASPIFVRPVKAGVFSRRQSCRGKSQSPVVWMAAGLLGNRDAEAHRQRRRKDGDESPGRNTSERKMWPRNSDPGGRALKNRAKAAGLTA